MKLLVRNSFEVLFIWYNVLVACISLSFLWRNHPQKVCGLALSAPSMAVAACIDAFPEKGRVALARPYFLVNIVGLVSMISSVAFSSAAMDDADVSFFSVTFNVSSSAVSTLRNLLLFGAKDPGAGSALSKVSGRAARPGERTPRAPCSV